MLFEKWKSYRQKVLASDHELEVQKAQRHFYAGAMGSLTAILAEVRRGTDPIEALNKVMDEISEFSDRQRRLADILKEKS